MKVQSIYDLLERITNDPKATIGKIIATNLMLDINSGDFKNINDLAKNCNCSISTITKFVQSIGFAGYRELHFLMKIEKKHYEQRKFNNKNISKNDSKSFEYFTSVLSWISQNQNWIISLANEINKSDEINIFTSHQTHPSAKYFYETLLTLGKRPVLINPSHQATYISLGEVSKKGTLNIFLISGRDNDTIFSFFLERLDLSKSSNFLVTTVRNIEKYDHNFFNSLIIDFEQDTPMFIYRDWLFHTLFLSIFEVYNESSFH